MQEPFVIWLLKTLRASPLTNQEELPLIERMLEQQHHRFQPTHVHLRSQGRYQVLGEVQLRPLLEDGWTPGVLYMNASGVRFVRAKVDFEAHFQELTNAR